MNVLSGITYARWSPVAAGMFSLCEHSPTPAQRATMKVATTPRLNHSYHKLDKRALDVIIIYMQHASKCRYETEKSIAICMGRKDQNF